MTFLLLENRPAVLVLALPCCFPCGKYSGRKAVPVPYLKSYMARRSSPQSLSPKPFILTPLLPSFASELQTQSWFVTLETWVLSCVSTQGGEAEETGSADCELQAVHWALDVPHLPGWAVTEGERPCSLPANSQKYHWKVKETFLSINRKASL